MVRRNAKAAGIYSRMVAGRINRIPLSTYRLQFNRNFTFAQATEIVPYLAALGISHCYASPYLRARPGSTHGYDIIDHKHLNPEIGTPEEYDRFVAALHEHGMGQILDVVPNHMGVMGSDNAWWLDVLENGEASAYADFFDIDWEPMKDELQHKVLVPVLGDQYGVVLERGELKLTFDSEKGEFSIFYFQHRFPVNPREYPRILRPTTERLKSQIVAEDENLLELESLITAFGHLPERSETSPERRTERVRDKELNKRRLAALCARSHQITAAIESTAAEMNGVAWNSAYYDALHELIKAQAFRLAYWRVAADDINYRRFFDVNDLAALCQENGDVFEQTHEFVLELLRESKINGLRIDHPDGLYNPQQYFQRLQYGKADVTNQCCDRNHYIVAEKILIRDEKLAESWPIYGSTGYDFANLVNGLFVNPDSKRTMTRTYWDFIGCQPDFKDIVYECKKLVIDRLLNSQLNVLANHLSQIALADRHTCDFTVKSLRDAITEVVACFPVYRTYVTGEQVSESDRQYIGEAVRNTKEKAGSGDISVYDFIRNVLTTVQAEGHTEFYRRSVVHFAMRFQQYTSAVMAKGLEDTALYRYQRLISLNDVGGDPLQFGITAAEFHHEMQARAKHWPNAMLATSTHDSKRSEDVRARINVLSEMPDLWREHVTHWHELNRKYKRVNGGEAPTLNDEYLLYQALVGAWPIGDARETPPAAFAERIVQYMLKAVREAKEKTGWASQNQEYESAVTSFVTAVVQSKEFCDDFVRFQRTVSHFGMLNSLSQTLLKLTAPGVPDIYQGNELWEFNLVDPDNRRAVDYRARQRTLEDIQSAAPFSQQQRTEYAQELATNMEDGRIKMYVIGKALSLRSKWDDLFGQGDYSPVSASGSHAKHVIAYARSWQDSRMIVVVPRLCVQLLRNHLQLPTGAGVWGDTAIEVPDEAQVSFQHVFTGEELPVRTCNGHTRLELAAVLGSFPLALLISGC
jgi:(1->4)-alpha-D-glucan 1-alpha-D-glucosylmutase